MRSRIIQIGNTNGIRISRLLLQQCQLEDEVELKAQPGQLVVRPVGSPRQGWEEAFEKIARYGNDAMLDVGGPAKDWSRKDWKW